LFLVRAESAFTAKPAARTDISLAAGFLFAVKTASRRGSPSDVRILLFYL
jgi:hypothetical protein